MFPKDTDILILAAGKYVTLRGERDVADLIKLRVLRWGNYPALSTGPNVIKSPEKREVGG